MSKIRDIRKRGKAMQEAGEIRATPRTHKHSLLVVVFFWRVRLLGVFPA
jgi:hypothetical protein